MTRGTMRIVIAIVIMIVRVSVSVSVAVGGYSKEKRTRKDDRVKGKERKGEGREWGGRQRSCSRVVI